MKMVKSLLLGSAAGVVAVTMGQAADLPVKAKPVEYVKICSLYGAGFYYMPGTDMCIKIGGWVRAEASDHTNGSLAWGPFNGNQDNRITSNFTARARGYITADAREQTAYGTARGYIAVGLSTNDVGTAASESANAGFSANRAFVQWAGFTAGLSQSFYDFYSSAALLYRAGDLPTSDTGDGGWWVWGYTAQLGNGVSATLSAEMRRMNQIIGGPNVGTGDDPLFPATTTGPAFFPGVPATLIAGGTLGAGSTAGLGYGGMQAPDVVGNIRVDQTWGGGQIMAAAHEVNPTYYSSSTAAGCDTLVASATTGFTTCGGPSDAKWGWAAGAGLRINVPMIAQGDYFSSQFNYAHGALRYLFHGENTNFDKVDGAEQAFGVAADCVYGGTIVSGTASGCELTTGWSVVAGYEHYWTPQVHQSLVGAYMRINYNDQANALLCTYGGDGVGGRDAEAGTLAVANPGCDMNWSYWGVGTRLQWDVTKSFYLGVEILYSQLNGAHTSDGLLHGFALGAPSAPIGVEDHSHNWIGTVRMHKDFLP